MISTAPKKSDTGSPVRVVARPISVFFVKKRSSISFTACTEPPGLPRTSMMRPGACESSSSAVSARVITPTFQ
jgi:hypothetical protein